MNTYNGWTNYQTWATNLWLSNCEHTEAELSGMAEQLIEQEEPDYLEELSSHIKYLVTERDYPENLICGLHSDLLNEAIREINYFEIAKAYIDSAKGNQS